MKLKEFDILEFGKRSYLMGNIIEQLADDEFLYLQPWFYNNELALRCELGIGEDDYMENAFSRAIQIANKIFANKCRRFPGPWRS